MKILKMNPFSMQGSPDENLRSKLDAYSVAPPAHVWGNIEAGLDKEKSRRGILFFILPVAFLLSLGGGAYWYLSNQHAANLVAVANTSVGVQANEMGNNGINRPATISSSEKVTAPVNAVGYNPPAPATSNNKYNGISVSTAPLKAHTVSGLVANTKASFASIKPLSSKKHNKDKEISALAAKTGGNQNNSYTIASNSVGSKIDNTSNPILSSNNDNTQTAISKTEKTTYAAKPATALADLKADKAKTEENKLPAKPTINPVDKVKKKASFDPSGWVWGIDLGPGYGGRLLYNSSGAPEPGTNINPVTSYNSFETQKFSMQEGIVFRHYMASPHWALQTGLYVINDGFNDKGVISSNDQFLATSNGNYTFNGNNSGGNYLVTMDQQNKNALSKTGTNYTISNNFWWLSVPAEFQYHFLIHNICYFVQGGGSLRLLMTKYGDLNYSSQPSGAWSQVSEQGTYKTFGFGVQGRAGVMVPLASDRLTLEFGPGFDFDLSSMTNGTAYGIYPYSFHFNAGIYKKF